MAQGSIGQAVRLVQGGQNPVRARLLDVLAAGRFVHYKELSSVATEIAEQIEAGKKEIETELKSGLMKGSGDDLSAAQKQSIEKELDGAMAMYGMQEAFALFEVVLAWYRDIELIRLGGDLSYLQHRDFADALQMASQCGTAVPIDEVQKSLLIPVYLSNALPHFKSA